MISFIEHKSLIVIQFCYSPDGFSALSDMWYFFHTSFIFRAIISSIMASSTRLNVDIYILKIMCLKCYSNSEGFFWFWYGDFIMLKKFPTVLSLQKGLFKKSCLYKFFGCTCRDEYVNEIFSLFIREEKSHRHFPILKQSYISKTNPI